MNPKDFLRKVYHHGKGELEENRFRALAADYDINGYERIYLVHIRKTGGTSLNHIFLGLAGEDSASVYARLANKPDHRVISGDKVYVGWNVRYINRGHYFYAFSHTPLHQLRLPAKTFTLACFRDPVRRVISHYNMLMDLQRTGQWHPALREEGPWLGHSFDDFLDRIPPPHLANQLYMFSERLDVEEAVARVAGLSHYFFTEAFAEGIAALNEKTGLELAARHIRKARYKAPITDAQRERLRAMLDDEYRFLDQLRERQDA